MSAIVERSLLVTAPFEGTLVLEPGEDGKFRLAEKLFDLSTVGRGVKPRGLDGKRLPAGHVLSRAAAERAVRTLLGLG